MLTFLCLLYAHACVLPPSGMRGVYLALGLCGQVVLHVDRLREMSPLWEMHLEGIDISKIEWSQH